MASDSLFSHPSAPPSAPPLAPPSDTSALSRRPADPPALPDFRLSNQLLDSIAAAAHTCHSVLPETPIPPGGTSALSRQGKGVFYRLGPTNSSEAVAWIGYKDVPPCITTNAVNCDIRPAELSAYTAVYPAFGAPRSIRLGVEYAGFLSTCFTCVLGCLQTEMPNAENSTAGIVKRRFVLNDAFQQFVDALDELIDSIGTTEMENSETFRLSLLEARRIVSALKAVDFGFPDKIAEQLLNWVNSAAPENSENSENAENADCNFRNDSFWSSVFSNLSRGNFSVLPRLFRAGGLLNAPQPVAAVALELLDLLSAFPGPSASYPSRLAWRAAVKRVQISPDLPQITNSFLQSRINHFVDFLLGNATIIKTYTHKWYDTLTSLLLFDISKARLGTSELPQLLAEIEAAHPPDWSVAWEFASWEILRGNPLLALSHLQALDLGVAAMAAALADGKQLLQNPEGFGGTLGGPGIAEYLLHLLAGELLESILVEQNGGGSYGNSGNDGNSGDSSGNSGNYGNSATSVTSPENPNPGNTENSSEIHPQTRELLKLAFKLLNFLPETTQIIELTQHFLTRFFVQSGSDVEFLLTLMESNPKIVPLETRAEVSRALAKRYIAGGKVLDALALFSAVGDSAAVSAYCWKLLEDALVLGHAGPRDCDLYAFLRDPESFGGAVSMAVRECLAPYAVLLQFYDCTQRLYAVNAVNAVDSATDSATDSAVTVPLLREAKNLLLELLAFPYLHKRYILNLLANVLCLLPSGRAGAAPSVFTTSELLDVVNCIDMLEFGGENLDVLDRASVKAEKKADKEDKDGVQETGAEAEAEAEGMIVAGGNTEISTVTADRYIFSDAGLPEVSAPEDTVKFFYRTLDFFMTVLDIQTSSENVMEEEKQLRSLASVNNVPFNTLAFDDNSDIQLSARIVPGNDWRYIFRSTAGADLRAVSVSEFLKLVRVAVAKELAGSFQTGV